MWKRVVGYGVLLAAGALVLQWLDYQRMARMHSGDIYLRRAGKAAQKTQSFRLWLWRRQVR